MTGTSVSSRNEKISLKQQKSEQASCKIADVDFVDTIASSNERSSNKNLDPQSSQNVSTAELVSAVGYAWDLARRPLFALLPETNSKCKNQVIERGGVSYYSTDGGTFRASTLSDDQPSLHHSNSKANFPQQDLKHLEVDQKTYPQHSYELPSFRSRALPRFITIDGSATENSLCQSGVLPNLRSAYSWMNPINLVEKKNTVNLSKIIKRRASNCCTITTNSSVYSNCVDLPVITSKHRETEIPGSEADAARHLDILSNVENSLDLNSATTTCSENDILQTQHSSGCNIVTSNCDFEYHGTELVSCDDSESRLDSRSNNLNGSQEIILLESDSSNVKLEKEKPKYALAKQEHAFAGAISGIFVSICLHPMDTIKTVTQSCRVDQKSLHNIGCSIIAERGVLGLYRGISSNIVSSAPISAVYTYTYESVKTNLQPLLSKEYHSLAHCIAGGSASIATSFIFTPSERIKQQMQVVSHYNSSWNAFVQVIRKGGVCSLYAGWGAVLCRNIPQSVIKFYTYESLKKLMLPSVQFNTQPNVLATLVCGGLAGCTASLFTTPFDVVKTRLQTQIPGSTTKYSGVFSTLVKIGKHEGLKGLYRGLTPRFVMYMLQGALFFASYESLKRMFSLEVPQTFHHEQKNR